MTFTTLTSSTWLQTMQKMKMVWRIPDRLTNVLRCSRWGSMGEGDASPLPELTRPNLSHCGTLAKRPKEHLQKKEGRHFQPPQQLKKERKKWAFFPQRVENGGEEEEGQKSFFFSCFHLSSSSSLKGWLGRGGEVSDILQNFLKLFLNPPLSPLLWFATPTALFLLLSLFSTGCRRKKNLFLLLQKYTSFVVQCTPDNRDNSGEGENSQLTEIPL